MVWEEMALDWNLTLGNDVVVQAWLSDASVAAVTAKGYKALAGNFNFWVSTCVLLPVAPTHYYAVS
jgi:hexosaminidase